MTTPSASKLIDERIASLGDWRAATFTRMRKLIHEADPEVEETWKWMGTPIWSHDGTRVAFSSDRGSPLGSDYNIWVLEVKTGELKQITKGDSEDFMPSWSPDDSEIVYASSRDNYESIWATNVRTAGERRVRSVKGGRVDAP